MTVLTRRRHPERPDCWHVYFSDVQVGTIAVQPGLPLHAEQWRSDCGFYPVSHRGRSRGGSAPSFDQARTAFEAAWKDYLTTCTESDFQQYRHQRDFTAWKYAMHDAGRPLPTATTSGLSHCFCGASIDNEGLNRHIREHHAMKAA